MVLFSSRVFSLWSFSLGITFLLVIVLETKSLWRFFFFHELGRYLILLSLVFSFFWFFCLGLFIKSFFAPVFFFVLPSFFETRKRIFVSYFLTLNSFPFRVIVNQFCLTENSFFLVLTGLIVLVFSLSSIFNLFLVVYLIRSITRILLRIFSFNSFFLILFLYFFQSLIRFIFLGVFFNPRETRLGILLRWAPLSLGLLTKIFLRGLRVRIGVFCLFLYCFLALPRFFLLVKNKVFLIKSHSLVLVFSFSLLLLINIL